MAARVPLVKAGNATSGPSSNGLNRSIRLRLANPPYLFDSPATDGSGSSWGGSITIQSTMDTMPSENNGYISNSGVTDANARWETIATLTNGGGPVNWSYPLYRVRANTSAVTGAGSPDVYMLEGIRSLTKEDSDEGTVSTETATET